MKKFQRTINKFLTTPLGSLVKTFLIAMLAFMVDAIRTGHITDWHRFVESAIYSGGLAVVNMIYKWLNPHDENFGRKEPPLDNLKADNVKLQD